MRESEVTKEYRYTCLMHGECIRVYYNLEVIVFLSFRIEALYTKSFREWIFYSLGKSQNRILDCDLIIGEYSSFDLN
ncbi:hypothetical protein [Dysgonomonas sp. Marseille-P4361]|uniref:hypothetical protein n=1 Tax=Dysgonomonas sp. Marseille-P4361 TaxID=2161820 RepID=UPI0013580A58|nr:hypothetical protein [Dysgonomonas sp. Marseille-P4361]